MTFSFAPISLGHTKPQDIKEASKPDFLDLDKDGNKEEPMKQAAQQAKMKKKKKNEDEPEGENGETAKMNPSMGSAKEEREHCHSKDHDCATVVEHPEWGIGKPIYESHAVPTDDGYVAWYDVEFAHGIEREVPAEDMTIYTTEKHLMKSGKEKHAGKKINAKYGSKHEDEEVNEYGTVMAKYGSKHKMKKNEDVNEVSFRPDDETSLGKRYADKVMRGDYSSKKTDNRKKGIATMTYKRAAQKGVPGVAKVPFKDHVEKDENMSIREKLMSVVERASHGNMDSQETYDDMYHGAGAKKMRKDHQNMKVDTTRALGVKDASAAGKVSKQAAARNSGDKTKTGDQKIVPPGTPMKDPAASKDMALENVMAAYKSMNKE